MIKELIHDPILLARKSEIATKEDLQVAQDLMDTLTAHKDGCVGMAANMIAYTVANSKDMLTSKNEAKMTLTIGNKGLIIKLSGYMNVPPSLHSFLGKLKTS